MTNILLGVFGDVS